MATLSTVASREALKTQREPHWQKQSKGCYLGFRKMTKDSEGTWIARCLVGGKQAYKALGEFSHLPAHQRHDSAKKAADAWFEHLGKGGSTEATTVAKACANYVEHLADTKGERAAKDAQARFQNYVLDDPKFAALRLDALKPEHIARWRRALKDRPSTSGPNRGQKRSDSTLNRDMTCFRAALNHAEKDGLISTDYAWRTKLLPIVGADRRREVYLDRAQRRALVACAKPDLAELLRAMSLVPLRPGALAALTVASYDKRLKTIIIDRDKVNGDRKVALPDETADFFERCCKGKLPGAPLLARENGKPWDKDAWKYPVRDAVTRACQESPELEIQTATTIYAIRHSVITDLIQGGLDMMTVARMSGTSLLMIERHYGHLTEKQARAGLATLGL